MTYRYLTDLADVLRAAGLTVVEIPGWKGRGYPGSFDPRGVLCHHTGSAASGLGYAQWMATVGRSDLDPPLAQLGLGADGTFYVLAAGRANHAGRCRAIAGLTPYPRRDYGDGNTQLLGIEAMNAGAGKWPAEQLRAYKIGCAALNTAYGWPVERTLAHRETSTAGKPDPAGIDMPAFRAEVAALMGRPAPRPRPRPTPLAVDGVWGPATTARLQAYLGTYVDGVVSGQAAAQLRRNPGLGAGWRVGRGGSPMVKALQRFLKVKGRDPGAVDGVVGPATVKALQRYLGTYVDGVVSARSPMVAALQARLNAGRL